MCYGVSLFAADRVSLRDADHHSAKSWAGTTCAYVGPASGSRSAATTPAAFDGVNRDHYF
jgi:hypothetical protein